MTTAADDPRLTRRQVLAAGLGAGALVATGSGVLGGSRLGGLAAAAQSRAVEAAGPTRVTIAPTTVTGAFPARSVGLSFEKSTLGLPLFSPDNAPLVAVFRLLGPGVLRLGGNSVERTSWAPTGPGLVPGSVSPADLDRLAGFAQLVDWQVLYGTPFVASTAAGVADEAAAVAARLGSRLDGIELCNEPDLYIGDPAAAAVAATFDLFRARWELLAGAVRAAVAAVALTGPATCLLQSVGAWTSPFAAAEAGHLSLVTQHYYRGFGGVETIDELLGPDPLLDPALATVAGAARDAGVGFRLGETNSFASGGAPGVSNTLASALWGVGLVLGSAARGAQGVNVHTSGAGPGYPPFVQVGGVVTEIRPLFYGLLLAAQAGPGTLVSVEVVDAPATLSAWAVGRPDGSLGVVVVNTDPTSGSDLTLEVGAAVRSATARLLTGPSLAATTGATFAGAPVEPDGTWDPPAAPAQAVAGSQVSTAVPAAPAGLIEITLAPASSTSTTSSTGPSPTTSGSTMPGSAFDAPVATPVAADPALTG